MADLTDPIDRLLKVIQAQQGIKGLFEPTAYQKSKMDMRLARHESIMNTHKDRISKTFSNEVLENDYNQFRQYYVNNVDSMNVEMQELFSATEGDYQRQFAENTDFALQKTSFYADVDDPSGIKYDSIINGLNQNIQDLFHAQFPSAPMGPDTTDIAGYNEYYNFNKYLNPTVMNMEGNEISNPNYIPTLSKFAENNPDVKTMSDLYGSIEQFISTDDAGQMTFLQDDPIRDEYFAKRTKTHRNNKDAFNIYNSIVNKEKIRLQGEHDGILMSDSPVEYDGRKYEEGLINSFKTKTKGYVAFIDNLYTRHGDRVLSNPKFKSDLDNVDSLLAKTMVHLEDDNYLDEVEYGVLSRALITKSLDEIDNMEKMEAGSKETRLANLQTELADGIAGFKYWDEMLNTIESDKDGGVVPSWEGQTIEAIFDFLPTGIASGTIYDASTAQSIETAISKEFNNIVRKLTLKDKTYFNEFGHSYIRAAGGFSDEDIYGKPSPDTTTGINYRTLPYSKSGTVQTDKDQESSQGPHGFKWNPYKD